MLTRIHVNVAAVKGNHNDGTNEPVITVKTYKSNDYCHSVEIHGPSKVVYNEKRPCPGGARVWIDTEAEVTLDPPVYTDSDSVEWMTGETSPTQAPNSNSA